MAYSTAKHGRADYGSWMQIPDATTITEGTDGIALKDQRFAQLVYMVNSSGGPGGTTDLTPVTEAVTAQTNTLMTALQEMIIDAQYSRVVQTVGTDTYVGQAVRGSTLASAVWRVQKIDSTGSRTWAGSGAFNQVATTMSGLTFAY